MASMSVEDRVKDFIKKVSPYGVILGSSRAARHYIPKVLEDSMGMSCYNCGEPGCGIITAYARYQMVRDRHIPKMVIYEVSPEYDYFLADDYSKYLGKVRQYSDKPIIKNMFIELGDKLEYFKLLSNMYKNNSFIVHNVMDNMLSGEDSKGFKPLYRVLKAGVRSSKKKDDKKEIDSVKLSLMESLIVEAKNDNVKLCFVVSPQYTTERISANAQESLYSPIIKLCQKYEVPFINHTYMEGISDSITLFQDPNHMNENGAINYTEAISIELDNI